MAGAPGLASDEDMAQPIDVTTRASARGRLCRRLAALTLSAACPLSSAAQAAHMSGPDSAGGVSSAPPAGPAQVQVWVELAGPPIGRRPGPDAPRPATVDAHQDELMARMRALGAVELGRVRIVRNAIAVEIAADRVDALRALQGVRRVSPVHHVGRPAPRPVR